MSKKTFALVPLLVLLVLLAACRSPQVQQADISVSVIADGADKQVTLPAGSTVQDALTTAGVTLGQIDRVNPPAYTLLSNGVSITVTRVREEFETQQVVIPFDRQELRNESLPAGETRLIQAGQNGLKEITIRHVFQDGLETGSSVVSETVLQPAMTEITMIGVQVPFAPLPIPGKLAYLVGGNAWLMEESTAIRRPLVTSGDLDSHIFSLSPDGKWLLFSRKSTRPAEQEINTLWVISTTEQNAAPLNLRVSNVVHFAAWQPGLSYMIAYSSVEPRTMAPGWQANNNLAFLAFDGTNPGKTYKIMDSSSGGIYGWWGTTFSWSTDGSQLAYARPDGIGTVNIDKGVLDPLMDITPLNTHSDWAWIPGLAWGADGESLYVVNHAPPTGLVSSEESPLFDLNALSLVNGARVDLVPQVGMFAYPSASSPREKDARKVFLIAFLQAIFPAQSETSRYRLVVMDSDGSDQKVLFPAEGVTGLEPQTPVWAPEALPQGGDFIAVIYQGNLWIIDITSGEAQQVTGDGLMSRIDWK